MFNAVVDSCHLFMGILVDKHKYNLMCDKQLLSTMSMDFTDARFDTNDYLNMDNWKRLIRCYSQESQDTNAVNKLMKSHFIRGTH